MNNYRSDRRNFADHIVAGVVQTERWTRGPWISGHVHSDEEVSGGIHRDARRVPKSGGGGGAAVTAVGKGVIDVPGDRGDHAGGVIDLADHVVGSVGDEEVPGGIQRDGFRAIQLGGDGGSAVAAVAVAEVVIARNRIDDAAGEVDLADGVVASVDDEEVTLAVRSHARGTAQLGGGGLSRIAAVAGAEVVIARNRIDDAAGEVDLADGVVASVGDEEVPGIQRDALRVVQFGGGGLVAVAAVA